jgi:DNA-3-methyladenine glycosylase
MAMGLSTKQNSVDVCALPLHIDSREPLDERDIVQTTRINVDYADEWKNLQWRFLVENNIFVSKQAK